jgi:ABC-2 type transport system permease protein
MTPDVSRPVPFARAARAVFDLALESMVWSRRTLVMGLLMALPVAFGLLYRVALAAKLPPKVTPFSLFGDVVVAYYLSTVLPLAALFYATALVADEVEGKTITYLLTRPMARPAILAGKFAAYLATTLSLALPATVVTFFLLLTAPGRSDLAPAVPDLFRDLVVVSLALLAYGALFTLLGVLLRRPTLPGLMFIFVWERLLSHLPGYLPRFTLISYLRSLVSHRPPETGIQGVFLQLLPAGTSLAVLLLASLVFLAAAVWIFSSREYVVEQ